MFDHDVLVIGAGLAGMRAALSAHGNGAEELGARAIQGSVLVTADLERLVETAMSAHGRIDGVVESLKTIATAAFPSMKTSSGKMASAYSVTAWWRS